VLNVAVGREPYGGNPALGQLALSGDRPYTPQVTQVHGRDMTMAPYQIIGEDRPSRWLVTCDHATNRVPPEVAGGSLGIADADMARHIAYDVGAAGLARALADELNAPAILSDFSRLVIDPNRGEDDPTLVMKLYDGTIIPANRHVDEHEVERRLDMLYRPYHAAYARLAARRPDTVIVSVHSFTPCLRGRAPRPWQVGILYSHIDSRLSRALIARLSALPDLCLGDNEPYSGHLPGDAVERHALRHGRHNTLIELRNDLIATAEAQVAWARRLAPELVAALAEMHT
jgi:predicted N-formylglutamate amidohydrolase